MSFAPLAFKLFYAARQNAVLKLERLKTYLDAERRKLSDAGESEASKRKREKDRQLLKFHDQHPMSGKKKKPRR